MANEDGPVPCSVEQDESLLGLDWVGLRVAGDGHEGGEGWDEATIAPVEWIDNLA